jgi:hypothetical protein
LKRFFSAVALIVAITGPAFAQAPQPAAASAAPAASTTPSRGCLAVADAGSHAFRNIMLGGVAGALVSKKQYKVVDVRDYPAHVGQKFHGNDLQTVQASGVRIVILDKKYTADDLHKACM